MPFQEVNILINRALLPNCKIDLTDSPFLIFFLKKTELLKQFYDKLILPEMPGGIIDQKNFFQKINICAKKWLFFPLKAIFDH